MVSMEKRLQNILALAGVASRRASGTLIEEGLVKVDGKIVREKGVRINPAEHRITVRGKDLSSEEKKYYFLFNKPAGVISTVTDTHGRKKITDFFRDIKARLYPVGRLDKDTTGAMIVTNDGELAYRLSHPSFGVEKEYIAVLSVKLGDEAVDRMSSGIRIEGKKTRPCEVSEVEDLSGRNVYRVKLHEGKKRHVRVMFASEGAEVLELDRVHYAGLSVENMGRGDRRELTSRELKILKENVPKNEKYARSR
jgi:23S rRNA pseudouridine2605 synthase